MNNYANHRLGKYQLLQQLGAGSFADVYLGEHVILHKRVAVKMFKSRVTTDETAHFLQEGRMLATLEHPHIVQVFDCGVEDHLPFLVTQYAPGGSLRQRYPRGSRLSLPAIVDYMRQIADALSYAHEKGIIHRDIKPENLLLGERETLLIGDFGIALTVQSAQARTQEAIGTLTYIAPEQLRGKPCVASDQYALGVLLYEWLCGEPPFQGSPEAVMWQQIDKKPPALRCRLPQLPEAVEAVVMRTLAKAPEERFASVQTFAAALVQASQAAAPLSLAPAASSARISPTRLAAPARLQRTVLVPLPSQRMATTVAQECIPFARPLPSSPKPFDKKSPLAHSGTLLKLSMPLVALLAIILAVSQLFFHSDGITPHSQPDITATAAARSYTNAVTVNGAMLGFDAAHTGKNPYEQEINATNVTTLEQYWMASTGVRTISSPIVADGMVYVGSDFSKLYAFRASGCSQPLCPPVWTGALGDHTGSAPAFYNGMVYIGAINGKLYAFRASGCGGSSSCAPGWVGLAGNGIYSSPVIADGVVYIGSTDHRVYAFNASGCGRSLCPPLWTATLSDIIYTVPAIANNTLYALSRDGKLYAFSIAACRSSVCVPLWTGSLDSSTHARALAVANGLIYVGADNGKLYAFLAAGCGTATCAPLWMGPTQGPIVSASAVTGDTVYVGSDDRNLYAFNAFGCGGASLCNPLWKGPVGGTIGFSSPFVANNIVYVGSADGKLYGFNTSCKIFSCPPIWTIATGGEIGTSPAVVNGVVYICADQLYAFHLSGAK